jgi:hypothetical protein
VDVLNELHQGVSLSDHLCGRVNFFEMSRRSELEIAGLTGCQLKAERARKAIVDAKYPTLGGASRNVRQCRWCL